jgi:hypothetical protein
MSWLVLDMHGDLLLASGIVDAMIGRLIKWWWWRMEDGGCAEKAVRDWCFETPRDKCGWYVLCQVDVSCAATLTLCWSWFGADATSNVILNIDKIVKGQVVCHVFEVRSLSAVWRLSNISSVTMRTITAGDDADRFVSFFKEQTDGISWSLQGQVNNLRH